MPGDFNIQVKGLEQVQKVIADLPKGAQRVANEAAATAIVDELKFYEKYKYASRAGAYGMQKGGPGFFSDKQRRFVMAGIRDGRIDPGAPHRTGEMQRGWEIKLTGLRARVTNAVKYAKHVMGTYTQARQPADAGWRTVGGTLLKSAGKINQAMQDAISQWILDGMPKR